VKWSSVVMRRAGVSTWSKPVAELKIEEGVQVDRDEVLGEAGTESEKSCSEGVLQRGMTLSWWCAEVASSG
jgi:hypothetical protein